MSAGQSDVSSEDTRRLRRPWDERIHLDPARSSTSAARRWLRRTLDGVVPDAVIDDAILVASELIANSVEHTSSEEILLRVRIERRGLVIEVHDEGRGLPDSWPIPGLRGRSRGLMMVGKLSSTVSSRIGPEGGGIVEAVIPLDDGGSFDA